MLRNILKLGKQELWLLHRKHLLTEHKLRWILWESTLSCNFSCKHCESVSVNKDIQGGVNTDEIKRVFYDIAQNFNANEIMIGVTGGEPLLRRDLFSVMSYANKLGFNWGMVSNGSLVTKETVKEANMTGMKVLDISIDGIDDVHDEFRNTEGAYERAVKALKLVTNTDYTGLVRVVTTVHSKNIDMLDKMYYTFSILGIKHWKLSNVDPAGRALCNPEIFLNKKQLNKLLRFIKEKRKNELSMKVTFGCSHYLGNDFEKEVRDEFFYCPTGINIGSILHNGDIFVCPGVPREKHLIQGNIKKDSFSQIWNNKFEIYRNVNRTACKTCLNCRHWNRCLGGSFHTWNFETSTPRICLMKNTNST